MQLLWYALVCYRWKIQRNKEHTVPHQHMYFLLLVIVIRSRRLSRDHCDVQDRSHWDRDSHGSSSRSKLFLDLSCYSDIRLPAKSTLHMPLDTSICYFTLSNRVQRILGNWEKFIVPLCQICHCMYTETIKIMHETNTGSENPVYYSQWEFPVL